MYILDGEIFVEWWVFNKKYFVFCFFTFSWIVYLFFNLGNYKATNSR